jgi:chromate transport protein ChrA
MLELVVLAEGATIYTPPGWVGGMAALLALVLPVALYMWMKSQN